MKAPTFVGERKYFSARVTAVGRCVTQRRNAIAAHIRVVRYSSPAAMHGSRLCPGHTRKNGIQMYVNSRFPQRLPRQGRQSIPLVFAVVLSVAALTFSLNACTKGNLGSSQQLPPQVLLEAASSPGSSPWMTTTTSANLATQLNRVETPSRTSAQTQDGTVLLSGDQVGLYGGSVNQAVCDRDKMVNFLEQNPAQGAAWRTVTGASDIRSYASTLSPVVLTHDTRVTNHGYQNGRPIAFQSALQTGTTVMVDNRGVPRVRCECGNPLAEPQSSLRQEFAGSGWQGLDTNSFVTIQKSANPIQKLDLVSVPAKDAPPPPTPFAALPLGATQPAPAPDVVLPPGATLVPVAVSPPAVGTTSVVPSVTTSTGTKTTTAPSTTSSSRRSTSTSTSTSAHVGTTSGEPSTTHAGGTVTSKQGTAEETPPSGIGIDETSTPHSQPAITPKPSTAPTR